MCHTDVPAGAASAPSDVITQDVGIAVEDGTLPGFLALPRVTPAPAVLIVNDAFGLGPFYRHLATRLAGEGYVALTTEYFFREGELSTPDFPSAMARMQQLDQPRTMRDLQSALRWMRARPEITRVGTMGFCGGGTLALALSAAEEPIDATVAFYGFPKLKHIGPLSPPEPIAVAGEMRGPILAHWGAEDHGVGIDNVEAFAERLVDRGVDADVRVHAGLGHGFLKDLLDQHGSEAHQQVTKIWSDTLAFLRERLGKPAQP